MIGKIKGLIDEIFEDRVVIDLNGLGLEIFCSSYTLNYLSKQKLDNQKVSLVIQTIVKESVIELYGFLNNIEKLWFLELNKVQGVGAKVALKILGNFSISLIYKALQSQDKDLFLQIPGIGPKIANRIIIELKDSYKKIPAEEFANHKTFEKEEKNSNSSIIDDAISALENLGYKKQDATNIVKQCYESKEQVTLEGLITESLRILAKNKFI
jgi:Holliday junction DNA helicase RuvA